ncbi:hypothetical protein BKP37_02175 [Anaerobacillus alkalilacustris]|uniref:Recombinase domain-containing protein n=1 Tax=Anaerobacillus alkalilacustris TaxID=393763 RepID=A0A1S2LYH3_9BACI|nr:hypothetical protein BKP37_02175 [Anaerobacillus alkalilacustris]
MNGKGPNRIARELESEGPNWNGKTKWYEGSIMNMLKNEKYKGDALLQKTYTVDYLTKKRVANTGQFQGIMLKTPPHPLLIKRCGKQCSLKWKGKNLLQKNTDLKEWTMEWMITPLQVK